MSSFILFLHGRYPASGLAFYKRLARGKTRIAVDGGLSFFDKAGLRPDLIIGDCDSIKRDPRKTYPGVNVVVFPAEKDKTDTQLAVEYAIRSGATSIDIVQPIFGEADHFAGNLMLLASLVERATPRVLHVRLINTAYEIIFLRDRSCVISKARGDTISVVPLTSKISLTCSGTAFPVKGLTVRRGETIALRNRVTTDRASIRVAGEAFVFHQFSK
jgi:thiamine pyrophosphokinase